MRSYNGHDYSMHKETYSWKTTPKEQVEINAVSTVLLTLSGQVITPNGDLRSQILCIGTTIELKGIFTNFTSLSITSTSPTKKFGLYLKTSSRQIQEPHDPTDKAYVSTLPEPIETQLQKLTRHVMGYESKYKQQEPGLPMEPEDFPFQMHEMDDDEPDVFEDDPIPQDALTPQASDPAVQPQGNKQPVPEAQPSPPTDEPQSSPKGEKTDA